MKKMVDSNWQITCATWLRASSTVEALWWL